MAKGEGEGIVSKDLVQGIGIPNIKNIPEVDQKLQAKSKFADSGAYIHTYIHIRTDR